MSFGLDSRAIRKVSIGREDVFISPATFNQRADLALAFKDGDKSMLGNLFYKIELTGFDIIE